MDKLKKDESYVIGGKYYEIIPSTMTITDILEEEKIKIDNHLYYDLDVSSIYYFEQEFMEMQIKEK